ncbi:MAG: transglutaminase family protein [Chromatiales bacterium]|nr:transglutaminase family protein [Chromatiales bacterium]
MIDAPDKELFERALKDHDARLAAADLQIWVGCEPTFTDRLSTDPEWLVAALGGDKQDRAERMLASLYRPGALVMRSVGRQYPDEPRPRWSIGLYEGRDDPWLWDGPIDPLVVAAGVKSSDAAELARALAADLRSIGWFAQAVLVPAALPWRVMASPKTPVPAADDPRYARRSVHDSKLPADGLGDELAEAGFYLFAIGTADKDLCLRVDMPKFDDVSVFRAVLQVLAGASRRLELTNLIVSGYPPPVDKTVAWTTLTPDPAVVEVNLAPSPDALAFFQRLDSVYCAAQSASLHPFRLQFNGEVSDSGGGGQITLGGPTALDSPFFRQPLLLPRLVRYFNRHPSLSYWFAPAAVGSYSQAPRPDERVRESFDELHLALALLERQEQPAPEIIWGSLAPFLTDPSGNTHRCEINIEKLWNPYLADRGRLGLVEFRAFRMARSATAMTALVTLLRSIAAMLSQRDVNEDRLVDWGRELHDRFSLPSALRADLDEVLEDLRAAGFGLDPLLESPLRNAEHRILGRDELDGVSVQVCRALEFWPLAGDTASQEGGSSRLMDASTQRLELSLRVPLGQEKELDRWRLVVEGRFVPLAKLADRDGPIRAIGLRYRGFVPLRGLHPSLGARGSVDMLLYRPDDGVAYSVAAHEWRPGGGAYPGLPVDMDDSVERRAERMVITPATAEEGEAPPDHALSPYCFDLRWL